MKANYREDLVNGRAQQANPVVCRLPRQRGHVAVHVVNFRTAVAAVESVTAVVAYCAPICKKNCGVR